MHFISPGVLPMSDFVYCLNTSTIRPTRLLEKVRVAGLAGYQAIEPWNEEIDGYLAEGGSIPELSRAIRDAGLKVVSVIALNGWITSNGAAHAASSRRMQAANGSGRAAWQPIHRGQPSARSR